MSVSHMRGVQVARGAQAASRKSSGGGGRAAVAVPGVAGSRAAAPRAAMRAGMVGGAAGEGPAAAVQRGGAGTWGGGPDADFPNHEYVTVEGMEEPSTGRIEAVSPDGISLSRKGYHTIVVGDCEFLVAKNSEGLYDLRDVYVLDPESGIYARPEVVGSIASEPALYQEVPWTQRAENDPWRGQIGKEDQVMSVYLVKVLETTPFWRIDCREVYSCDGPTRTLRQMEVKGLPADIKDEDLKNYYLAFRGYEVAALPEVQFADPEVICAAAAGTPGISDDEKEAMEKEIEVLGSTFDVPDVPEVDLM